jgi:micrococcal nuclease
MKTTSNFLTWWKNTYKKQKPLGKIALGCLSLTIFCCFFSIPINLLTPDSDRQILVSAEPSDIVPIPTQSFTPQAITSKTPIVHQLPKLTRTPQVALTPKPTSPQAFLSAPSCVPENSIQTGNVVDVVDGDTIKVSLNGEIFTVRYIGIDTPESTIEIEYFGEEASNKNKELVSGQEVTLIKDVSETDYYGRLLRYVFVGDVFVNYELVNQGYAMAYTDPPDISCKGLFLSAQSYARFNQLGLWAGIIAQATATIATPEQSGYSVKILRVNKVAEYVDILNFGPTAINLSGWVLLSETGDQSCFLEGIIQSGEILRIWAGNPDQPGYKCGISGNIWNNDESDPAVLYDDQGREVSRQ